MKKMKKIMQLCLAVLTVITVVSVAKIDTRAAEQITGFKQVGETSDSVALEWDRPDMTFEVYELVYYRPWGSGEAWKTTEGNYIGHLTPGTSYEVKVALYSDYERSVLVAETPNSIEVVTAPGAYKSFAVKQKGATTTSVTISWNEYPGANYFRVNDVDYDLVQYVDGNQMKVTKLPVNQNVIFRVTPCRKSSTGYVAVSTSNEKYVDATVVPVTPKIRSMYVLDEELRVSMSLKKGEAEPDRYEYDIYKVKGNKRVARGKNKTFVNWAVKNKAFGSRELFKIKVRGYNKVAGGKKYYSPWSSMYYFTTPIKFSFLGSKGSQGIELKWYQVRGASGYKVYAATKDELKKYKVVATIKKGTTTGTSIKKFNKKALKKGQFYYFMVVPYYKSGKKIIEADKNSVGMLGTVYK